MPSNLGFKDSVLLVNSNLVGIRDRTKKNQGETENFALRSSWGCEDRFRGVLGKYFAKYNTQLVNFADDTGLSDYDKKQVVDVPFRLTEIPTTGDNIGLKSAKFLIELDNTAWNNLNYGTSTKDLLRKYIAEEGIEEGDPYWGWYLKNGMPDIAAPFVEMPPIIDTTATFTDHTTQYYSPSADEAIRAKSGTIVKVEPVYNYYADTTPPYEAISKLASEPMLTNFYCLESEMRNTGSTLNSPDYFAQLTLDNRLQEINIDNDAEADPLFQQIEGPEGGMTESKTVQLYTLYSKGVNALHTGGGLGDLKGIFNAKYKNIVILNSDLKAMSDLITRDDQTSGLRNLPFYNKITIGYDREGVGDYGEISKAGGASWLRELQRELNQQLGDRAGAQLIDMMQLYIIQNIEGFGTNATTIPFEVKNLQRLSDTDPTDSTSFVASRDISLVFNLEDFLTAITTPQSYSPEKGYAPTRIDDIVDRINTNTTTDDNFILIRDYNQNPIEIDTAAADAFLLLDQNGGINYPLRTIKQIVLENKLAVNETLLYKIDKHVIDAEGKVSAPVQTFYIGRFFDQARDIHYVDSQVKYGVRYRYNISEIKIVFGSKYSYANLDLYYRRSDAPGSGRAVGNALGFYRPIRSDILLDDIVDQYVKEYTPVDEDLPLSLVRPGAAVGESAHTGYYIFKPAKDGDKIDVQGFSELFANGTDFVGAGAFSAPDRDRLAKVHVEIKEGFGLGGNANGGAVGDRLDLPPVMVAAPALPAPPALPKKTQSVYRKPPKKPPLQSTYRKRAKKPRRKSVYRPRKPNKRPRKQGTARPARRTSRRATGPGGATPTYSPGFLRNLFGPR